MEQAEMSDTDIHGPIDHPSIGLPAAPPAIGLFEVVLEGADRSPGCRR